jgi:antitoxin VapB
MGVQFHARVFRNGRSRAVRIPSGIDLPGDEMIFRQEGNVVTIAAADAKPRLSLGEWLAGLSPLAPNDRFPEIDDPPPEPIDW